jgi:hypothetical protein
MNMVMPNEGKLKYQYWALCTNGSDLEDFVVDLFVSNTTVGNSSTAADFTIASFTGYAQVAVTRASLSAPAITSNVAYTSKSTPPSFTCTGGSSQTAYGWIMRGATSGKIIFGQNFDVARVMSAGATETLTPFQFGQKTLD